MDFSALKDLVFKKPEEFQKHSTKGKKIVCNAGDFAITKSGKILFSSKLREEVEAGHFLDVINGNKMTPAIPYMFLAIVPGDIKKSPRATIKQEGKVSSIDNFVKPMANSVYGVNWEVTDKVEFTILWDNEVKTEEPYFYFPCEVRETKVEENGAKTTTVAPSYNRRDASTTRLYPIVPFTPVASVKADAVQTEIPFEDSNLLS